MSHNSILSLYLQILMVYPDNMMIYDHINFNAENLYATNNWILSSTYVLLHNFNKKT